MVVFWNCKTTENSKYHEKIEYLSEPSIDLIAQFKKEIVTFEDPKKHESYVKCDDVERSKGHLLFVLYGRVEVLIRPDKEMHKLFFMDCADN